MSKKILIVDDSIIARMLIVKHIQVNHSEWEVFEAGSAKEALDILENQQIDLVSIDYNMPETNGIELINQIREKYPETHISMITANIQGTLREKVENMGVSFFEKPITGNLVEELLKT